MENAEFFGEIRVDLWRHECKIFVISGENFWKNLAKSFRKLCKIIKTKNCEKSSNFQ